MPEHKTLGISINELGFSFTEIDYSGETPLVLNIGSGKFPSKLLLEDLERSGKINLFANSIANALRDKGINQSRKAAIGLDSSFALIHKFQVDAGLDKVDFTKHLEWELEKISGENAEKFNFDYHKFPDLPSKSHLQTIIIFAVNKKIIDFFSQIAKIAKLNLVSLDLDITSVFKLLEISYSDTKLRKPNLFVKFSDLVKITLFQFDSFWELTLATNEPNSISEAINYLFTKYSNSHEKLTSVANIFYYSDKEINPKLIKHLGIISSNPPLQITPNLIFQNEEGSVMATEFIESISLALKNN
ncbi:MAG: hypothetical protein DWQ06_09945 [Calditrichaeota bacterium]|nr:MAG: hypothetical protein DWQ06_09945 [Calditrichota bacterium]